jgi:hypothetical protein
MMQETKPDWQHHGVTIIAMNGDYRCSVSSKRKLWLPKITVLQLFLSDSTTLLGGAAMDANSRLGMRA